MKKVIFNVVLFDKYAFFPNTKRYKYCIFSKGDIWERKFGFVWVKQK